MHKDSDLITVGEAARTLRLAEQTIRNLEKRGVLQGSRLSNGIRIFEREQVERLAQRLAQKST